MNKYICVRELIFRLFLDVNLGRLCSNSLLQAQQPQGTSPQHPWVVRFKETLTTLSMDVLATEKCFGCFYLECAEICWYIENCPFPVFFGATYGNLMERYSVTPSWHSTCLWQMTGVRIVLCRSADFNMFQMTYKYNSVSSEDFGLLKFPWKKVQHSASGWYAHDLRYMFVVTWSSPPWRLINFF